MTNGMESLTVDRTKVTDYLLDPARSRGKAAFFLRMGFSQDRWDALAEALKRQARNGDIVAISESPYGTRYSVDGGLETPDRREPRPRIRTVWIEESAKSGWRLITAHPVW